MRIFWGETFRYADTVSASDLGSEVKKEPRGLLPDDIREALFSIPADSIFGLKLPSQEGEARNFIDAFLNAVQIPLAPYLPQNIPESSFKISPLISTEKDDYDPKTTYEGHGRFVTEPLSGIVVYIDGPLAYALVYKYAKRDKKGNLLPEKWEPISVAAFVPDFANSTLLVNQLQGGTTERKTSTHAGRQIRFKFVTSPEEILFKIVRELAVETGIRIIGLRKPGSSKWPDIYNPDRREGENRGPETLYSRVAKSQVLKGYRKDYFTARAKK